MAGRLTFKAEMNLLYARLKSAKKCVCDSCVDVTVVSEFEIKSRETGEGITEV